MPFAFVENRGQAADEVRYIGNGPDFKAWFRDNGVVLQQGAALVHVEFVGSGAGKGRGANIRALFALGATANYLRGSDPAHWQRDLPLYGAIRYEDVWTGIDVQFRAEEARAKAEYLVAPGAAVGDIGLRFDGRAAIQRDGSLVVSGRTGVFREEKPVVFQEIAGARVPVQGRFDARADGTVGFVVGDYDATKPLVIDPVILFSGYFGGVSQTNITAVAINANYNVVVAGWTTATDLPTTGGARPRTGGGVDAFVASFSPSGGALAFCTYLGGSGDDRAFGLAVDSALNTYVTGWTSSTNFPLAGALQTRLGGTRDAFVAKLNPAGNALVYSTYLGGSGVDVGYAIALDSGNAAVITGDTTSSNLPTTTGVVQPALGGAQDAFVAKLSADGRSLGLLTYFGGSAVEHSASVKLDLNNAIFIGGSTSSTNFPTQLPSQPQLAGGQDAFLTKLAADAKSIVFSTFLGGTGGSSGAPEQIAAIAVSASGNATVAGTTSSIDFPVTPGVPQATYGGGQTDGFITRFSAVGGVAKSTYLGGSLNDGITSVALDYRNDIYVAGYTSSTDFPVQRPIQSTVGGGLDAFVAKISFPTVEFATYLGGSGNDSANGLAVDALTSVVVVGSTGSPNFPVAGSVGAWGGGALSSFVAKLAPNFNEAIVAAPLFNLDPWHTTGYNGANSTIRQTSFGLSGDIPVAGDWDGSGKKRIGVFRNGAWLLDINGNGVFDAGDKTIAFGQAGDLPVVGDWTGTGTVKLGLFRNGNFILDLSGHLSGVATGVADANFSFGLAGDLPVAGDWNSSGTSKVGVFRSGQWLIDYNGDRIFNGLDRTYTYGQAGDIPLTGDWDSSGSTKLGLYRAGTWILDYHAEGQVSGSTQFSLTFTFGSAAYKPLTW